MAVPYTFATATSAIPLSNLDTNFATAITLGNTAVYLGNTTTSFGNVTLTNATISSVASTFPNSFLANSTATLGNATITLGGTTTNVGNLTLANVTITSVGTTFPNSYLSNSAVTIGNTSVSLGSTVTSFGNVTLTNATISSVSTPLTVAQGGTGLVTITANGLMTGNGTGNVTIISAGTTGNVLTSNGTAWLSTAPSAFSYPSAGIVYSTGSAWGSSYTTSGSGTVLALNNTPTLTNPTVTNYVETLQAVGTVGSTSTLSLTTGTVLTATLTASTPCTFTMPTATAGKSFILKLIQASSGMTTATFTSVKWPGGTAPTITATASAVDILSFVSDGTNWYGTFAQAFA
jgi:type VI protein secretion system component Hcp